MRGLMDEGLDALPDAIEADSTADAVRFLFLELFLRLSRRGALPFEEAFGICEMAAGAVSEKHGAGSLGTALIRQLIGDLEDIRADRIRPHD